MEKKYKLTLNFIQYKQYSKFLLKKFQKIRSPGEASLKLGFPVFPQRENLQEIEKYHLCWSITLSVLELDV